eukprot:13945802-Alexandrium_andersonii.AAC.1
MYGYGYALGEVAPLGSQGMVHVGGVGLLGLPEALDVAFSRAVSLVELRSAGVVQCAEELMGKQHGDVST